MVCDECRLREATVHLTQIINGKKTERHLCPQCARKHEAEFFLEPQFSIHNLLAGLLEGTWQPPAGAAQDLRCSRCGLRYREFARTGLLGCSHCYDEFKQQLEPVLRRIQGQVRHRGKVPSRAGSHLRLGRQLDQLRAQLREAVAREEYERAARLRDEIRALEQRLRAGDAGGTGAPHR